MSKDEVFDFAKLNDSLIISNSITLEAIESRISKHPNIKSVHVTRESSTIRIEISEKDPFAFATNGKRMYLIDDKLNLYSIKKENKNIDIPIISGLSELLDMSSYGENDMKNLKIAQYLIKQSLKLDKLLYNYISEINFSDSSGIRLYTFDDATPIYFLDFDEINTRNKQPVDIGNLEITNSALREIIQKKLLYLDSFLKQVVLYKSRNSFSFVDMRYQDIILAKDNLIPTTEK